MRSFIFCLFALGTFQSGFSQIQYKNGKITDVSGAKLAVTDVRYLLRKQSDLLASYDSGRNKKTIGNILLYGGLGLATGNFVARYAADKSIPGAVTIVGAAAAIISIPVKIGYKKKIRNAIDGYNQQLSTTGRTFKIDDLTLCSNDCGIGIKLIF